MPCAQQHDIWHGLDTPEIHTPLNNPGKSTKLSTFTTFMLLISCGDIEFNLGPIAGEWPPTQNWEALYPCGCCEFQVVWSHLAVCCDECQFWYHKTCASMTSAEYDHIENVSWKCCKCNTASSLSFLHQAYNLNVFNSFDALAVIPGDDSVFLQEVASPSLLRTIAPQVHSSPAETPTSLTHNSNSYKASSRGSSIPVDDSSVLHCSKPTNNLLIVIANMNSIKDRKAQLTHPCATTAPGIILACETKVDKTIKHTEFLPANYTGHKRLDRTNRGGRVMICHRKDLVIDKVELIEPSPADHHDGIVWARLTVKEASPVYIGSYYKSCTNYKTNGGVSNHKADSISGLQSSLDSFSKMHIRNNTHATIMLGGDFKVADKDWVSNTSIHGSPMQALTDKLLSTVDDHDLVNLQHEATSCNNPRILRPQLHCRGHSPEACHDKEKAVENLQMG